ncbi:MAG: SAM-dependent methyltransferase [Anaerolineae bacterium]
MTCLVNGEGSMDVAADADLLEIARDVEKIERDVALCREDAYAGRAEALNALAWCLDRLHGPAAESGARAETGSLRARAEGLREAYAALDERLYRRARDEIAAGDLPPKRFRAALERLKPQTTAGSPFGPLDDYVEGVLGMAGAQPAGGLLAEAPEMVSLYPTPTRVVLDLLERAGIRPTDHFYDMGSGLGQVVMLVALLSGARATGIEYQPSYCDAARRCAERLNLDVRFVNQDARDADYGGGTVFYLYTPFRGQMLDLVLERLRTEAQSRPIRVATYGPCTPTVAAQRWLEHLAGDPRRRDECVVFGSR